MRPAGKIKQFFDLVFDGEIFNLAWITVKNVFHKPRPLKSIPEAQKERAKAVKAFH
jgi:hypothetical protein